MAVQPFIVGNPVLVVVDIQNGDPPSPDGDQTIPHMESDGSWVARAAALISKCREVNVPIVFIGCLTFHSLEFSKRFQTNFFRRKFRYADS